MLNLSRLGLRAVSICALLCAVALVCRCAFAQTGFASISGRVADHSGAIIQKADVTLKSLDTGVVLSSQSNNDGIYSFPSVQPGNYMMRVEKQGFRSVDVTGLTLYTQDQLARNFTLEVGSTSESITVTAGASNDSPAVSMTVTRGFIENMPLNGRSLDDLIALAPGASPVAGVGLFSIDGQRSDANNFTVDGVSANLGGYNNAGAGNTSNGLSGSIPTITALGTTQSLVALDALQEFTIQTSSYTAEYGRLPGGQVEFTTRSGSDTLHGSLFEYLRNTVFDANSWTNDHHGLPKGAERQNDFGGTLGGPLQIPHFYDGKGKTFYFASYEGLRLLLPASGLYGVPSDSIRAWASPNVQPFLDALPDPAKSPGYVATADGCTVPTPPPGETDECDGTIPYSYSNRNNLDAFSLRADHNLSSRWRLFVRYADTPSEQAYGGYNPSNLTNGSHLWTVGLNGALSQSLSSETRFNFGHESEDGLGTLVSFQGSEPWNPALLTATQYLNPYSKPDVVVDPSNSSLSAATAYGGGGTHQRQYQLVQSVTWTRGSHTLKFGADWRHLLTEFAQTPYESYTNINSMTDVQEGTATTLEVTLQSISYPVFDNLSVFAQDHWRLNSRLTLDYGLRWDFNPPPGISQGLPSLAVNEVTNPSLTQAEPLGTPLYQTKYTAFGPRLGFAYILGSPSEHTLVLRAGGGLYFDTGQEMTGGTFEQGFPYNVSGPVQSEVSLPLSQTALAAPALNLNSPSGVVYVTDPNLTMPYTEQWSLSLERSMSARNALTASYVGNVGRKLLSWPCYCNSTNLLNYPSISENGAHSSYNGLQVSDNGYIGRDLQIVGSYTYSHALDNLSNDSNYFEPQYGNSNYDLRHVFNVALSYRVPLQSGGFLRTLGSGWLIAPRFTAQTGLPLDLYQDEVILANDSYVEYRPNLVPGVPIYLHGAAADVNGEPAPGNWRLNRAAFACTTATNANGSCSGTPTMQGTLGRNYVRDPGFYNINLSAERTFPVYERLNLSFRVDAFNILNHPNLAGPNIYTFADSQFGVLGSAETIGTPNQLYATGAARSLQFNLHFHF
jgi:hypothetical protein